MQTPEHDQETRERIQRIQHDFPGWRISHRDTTAIHRKWTATHNLPPNPEERARGIVSYIATRTVDELLTQLGQQQRLRDTYIADLVRRHQQ